MCSQKTLYDLLGKNSEIFEIENIHDKRYRSISFRCDSTFCDGR